MFINTLVNVYLPCLSGIGAELPQFDESTFRNAALRVPVATGRPPRSWLQAVDNDIRRRVEEARWRFTQGLILELFDRWP